MARRTTLPFVTAALLLASLPRGAAAASFIIAAHDFDRGNVRVSMVGQSYAAKYPCIWNGNKYPNQAEYDIDFPLTTDYTFVALYTAAGSRPVDIYLDGERVHTGKAEALNREFARSFTKPFGELCEKYPVYAELRNVCDLALAAALIRQQGMASKVGWHLTCFGGKDPRDPLVYQIALGSAPEKVDTVANYRVIRNRKQIHTIAGVSGGVRVDPTGLVATSAIETTGNATVSRQHSTSTPGELPAGAWWWD